MTVFANLSFAVGSQFFTHYSKKFSSIWMNAFKAVVAGFCFLLTVVVTTGFHHIEFYTFLIFFISGFIGLGIGDIFLLKAFERIGPGRTLVIFGFHPVIVGILSFIILSQKLESNKIWSILFFIICLIIFSYENFKKNKSWEILGLVYAFAGMAFDAGGVLITRYAFDLNTNITAFEGNFYRCIGAMVSFLIIRGFSPFQFRSRFKSLSNKSRIYVILGALFGTYISLSLYLYAIQTSSNLAIISAISITSVIFSSVIECVWDKKLPSKYLLLAFVFFFIGMLFLFDL